MPIRNRRSCAGTVGFISPRELQVGAGNRPGRTAFSSPAAVFPEPATARAGGGRLPHQLLGPASGSWFPESLIIIGGGVIALEMGQMFCRFGTQVTIVERGERALKEFDPRLTAIFQDLLEEEGISLVFNVETQRVFRDGNDSAIVARIEGEERTLRAEKIMFAVGTAPATTGIGLEAAGVQMDDGGFIVADEECRTTAPNIWAAGDVTGPPLIAPAGVREAEVAVENLLDPSAPSGSITGISPWRFSSIRNSPPWASPESRRGRRE